jgi:hypothetical protein
MYFNPDQKAYKDAKPCPSKEEIQLRVASQDVEYFLRIKEMWPVYEGVQFDSQSDGDGEQARVLFWFMPYNLYVMISGVYSSHGDTSYDEVYFVRARAVMVTDYERV